MTLKVSRRCVWLQFKVATAAEALDGFRTSFKKAGWTITQVNPSVIKARVVTTQGIPVNVYVVDGGDQHIYFQHVSEDGLTTGNAHPVQIVGVIQIIVSGAGWWFASVPGKSRPPGIVGGGFINSYSACGGGVYVDGPSLPSEAWWSMGDGKLSPFSDFASPRTNLWWRYELNNNQNSDGFWDGNYNGANNNTINSIARIVPLNFPRDDFSTPIYLHHNQNWIYDTNLAWGTHVGDDATLRGRLPNTRIQSIGESLGATAFIQGTSDISHFSITRLTETLSQSGSSISTSIFPAVGWRRSPFLPMPTLSQSTAIWENTPA